MRFLFSIFLVFASIVGAQAQCDSGEKIIRLGSFANSDHLPRDKGVALFQDAVNRELQGKACVEIILSETRFHGTIGISALQNGEVQMLTPSFATLGQFVSSYQVFDLPFAFQNLSAVTKFQAITGNDFITALSVNGLQPLAFWHGNFKQISGKKPVYLPVDVAGLKFRTDDGASFGKQVSALSSTAQPIAENDLTIAVKSGKVDMQITNWARLEQDGTGNIFSGVSETNHGFVGYQMLASKIWWADLDTPLRKSLSEIIGRVSRQLNFETASRVRRSKQNLMRAGVVVRALTRHQRKAWRAQMQGVWSSYNNGSHKVFVDALAVANSGL
ncbi:MAG: TRAP transporter substrate-binding protein DctP [Rhizobiaceae bacterium]